MISKIKFYGRYALGLAPAAAVAVSAAPALAATSLDEVVGNATSSVANTLGFSMDSVGTWMWVNLGQPILGTGLGTLLTMRYFILSIIVLGIIIYFAFRYFGFFKH